MRNAVDGEHVRAVRLRRQIDAVVRRPPLALTLPRAEDDEQHDAEQQAQPAALVRRRERQDRQHAGDSEPERRCRLQQRAHGEQRDAEDRAGDIGGVGRERGQRTELLPQRQSQDRERRGDEERHERQDEQIVRLAGVLGQTEEQLVGWTHDDVESRERDQSDRQQRHRAEKHRALGRESPAEQDADADAEEAADQQDVGEEAEVDDGGRDPAQQQQLDEQDEGAGQKQLCDPAAEPPADLADQRVPSTRCMGVRRCRVSMMGANLPGDRARNTSFADQLSERDLDRMAKGVLIANVIDSARSSAPSAPRPSRNGHVPEPQLSLSRPATVS
ncbi:MAG: hypothetical protein AUH85_07505 [Chloroflexi bacterium 13_1_40CM_4_68_4]|nr:MAG: hypothetical protein AUH85_07505 [Chloroflexi bacterium 13_1_40CM_4_68_4]